MRQESAPIPDALMLAPYPPPLGGISTHVERLQNLLENRGVRVAVLRHHRGPVGGPVLSSLNRNPVRYWLAIPRYPARVVHYHHSRWSTLLAVALRAHRDPRPYVCTIHGHELVPYLHSRLPGVSRATRWLLSRFDELVAVSDEVAQHLSDIGPRKPHVIPAYLVGHSTEPLDAEALAFVDAHETLLVSAYRVHLVGEGDLYGLDIAVDTFISLAREHPKLGLALFLAVPPRWRQRRYLAELFARLEAAGVKKRTLVRFGKPLAPIFEHHLIYIRPTRSEGDAVSVREALDAGVRVVASDIVGRPANVAIFASGDPESLAKSLRPILASHNRRYPSPAKEAELARTEELVSLYERLLGRAPIAVRPLAAVRGIP